MGHARRFLAGTLGGMLVAAAAGAQAQDPNQTVQRVVNQELAASTADQSHWRYMETEMDHSSCVVVETENGAIKRHIDEDGHPASPATLREDDAYIQKFIHDPSLQAKQRKDGANDDKSFAELLNLFSQAFTWKVMTETAKTITLSFEPNPSFHPPDMEARVMGAMGGTMIVDKPDYRIHTFKGSLGEDVTIGFGFLARIKHGSTFDIERRQMAPGLWELTETHVHISGHALFFKTIGTQQDEVKSDFTLVPPGTTLAQAVGMLAGK